MGCRPPRRFDLRTALTWGLIGLGIHVFIVVILFAAGDTEASFVHFGAGDPASAFARQVIGPSVPIHAGGGDGVPFWVIARDPTLAHVKPLLDRPTYRADRIGYPLLAAPWRIAGENALLWGLLLTNLAVAFVGTFAAAAIAMEFRAPARAGLAFALCPGVTASTWLDVCDAMALALLLVTALAVQRRAWTTAVLAAAGAALTKEVTLVPIAGLFVLGAVDAHWMKRIGRLAVPAAALGGWALYVRARLGWPAQEATDIVPPLSGYVKVLRHERPYGTDLSSNAIAVVIVIVAVVAIALWVRRRTLLSTAALPMALLALCFGPYVVGRSVNSLRAAGPLLTLVALDLYGRDGDPKRAEGPGDDRADHGRASLVS